MTQPQKFNFDLDLAAVTRKTKLMEESDIELLISQAKEAGYNEGYAEGIASIQSQTAQQIAAAAETVAGQSNAFLETLDNAQQFHMVQASKLATSVGHKLAAQLVSLDPTAEIENLIKDCLSSIGASAHLVIRCGQDVSDAIKPIAENFARQSGYDGRLIIMGEPDIAPGDCRIEWSDGGIARNMDHLVEQVEKKISQFADLKLPTATPVELEHSASNFEQEHASTEQSAPELDQLTPEEVQ